MPLRALAGMLVSTPPSKKARSTLASPGSPNPDADCPTRRHPPARERACCRCGADLGQALEAQRVVHVRTARRRLDQARRPQPVEVVDDRARAQLTGAWPDPRRKSGLPSASRPTMRRREASDSALRATSRSASMVAYGSAQFDDRQTASCRSNRGTGIRCPRSERSIGTSIGTRQIGPHLPLATGLSRRPIARREIGATAVQIWTDNPTAWRRRTEQPGALAEFRVGCAGRHPDDRRPCALSHQPVRCRRGLLAALDRHHGQ